MFRSTACQEEVEEGSAFTFAWNNSTLSIFSQGTIIYWSKKQENNTPYAQAADILKELRDPNKATSKMMSSIKGNFSW